MGLSFSLSKKEQAYLGKLVRWAIAEGMGGKNPNQTLLMDPPYAALCVPLGCFVTLNLCGSLRGCIGTMVPQEPLYKNAVRMAASAAFNDPRFPPLTEEEWKACQCEVSVLGPMSICPDPECIEVGRHGLVLQMLDKSGVFLPQVPVEAGWDRLEYLEHLCEKAGLPHGCWREKAARLYWFEAFVFEV